MLESRFALQDAARSPCGLQDDGLPLHPRAALLVQALQGCCHPRTERLVARLDGCHDAADLDALHAEVLNLLVLTFGPDEARRRLHVQ